MGADPGVRGVGSGDTCMMWESWGSDCVVIC